MRFPLIAPSLRLFVVAAVVFFGSATLASAQTCPGATPNDGSDDFTAIQNCLNAGGTVRLDDGYYWIGQTLELWHDSTVLTNNGGGRPALLATPNLFGPILEVKGASYWELRDLEFGGMLYSRNFAYECGSGVHRKFGNNLFVNGNYWKIVNVDSGGAMCGSSLEVEYGSNWEIYNSNVSGNGRSWTESGVNERWSDGITLLNCNWGYVGYNYTWDNTDIGIVVGGGQNCVIEWNNIRNYEKYGFAGFHVGNFNQSGNHADAQYRYNDVASWYDQQSFGIVIGFHPWNATLPVPYAGHVNDNWTWGAVVNLAIDGISDGEIQRNTFGAYQGSRGFSSGAPATCAPADYTAGDFGSASKQGGYINRIYHPC